MNYVEPIRNKEEVKAVEDYLKSKNERNRLIFVFGINTGLRVSDLSYYFPFKCVCSCHFYLSFMNNLF